MRHHVIAAYQRISANRYQLLLTTGLLLTFVLLVFVAPLLLTLAGMEIKRRGRKHGRQPVIGLILIGSLVSAIRWLWRELHGMPHRAWRPCTQCGAPIEAPSRRAYCSHACRSYARLERDALDNDPRIAARAERRLRNMRLRQLAVGDPRLDEVPF
jgi:hypothetical protein